MSLHGKKGLSKKDRKWWCYDKILIHFKKNSLVYNYIKTNIWINCIFMVLFYCWGTNELYVIFKIIQNEWNYICEYFWYYMYFQFQHKVCTPYHGNTHVICYIHNFYSGYLNNVVQYFSHGLISIVSLMFLWIVLHLKELQQTFCAFIFLNMGFFSWSH